MITDSMYNRTICIDEDFDFDFTNNRAYKFTPETSYYPIVHIRTRQALNNDTLISYMPYQLQAFNNRVMIRGIMQEQTLTEAWNKEGTFVVNNNTYIIWLKEYLLNREGEKDFSFRFREVNDSTTVTAVYGRNDTITVDRWRYKIELNGNRLKFINTGSYSGHALDFQRKDLISKRNIQLTDFRGKYVLLDFWGSWCLPCIEGIPELKKLAATYSEKLEIISIAFDRDADIPKLKSIVRTYDMDWHHIREPREFNDSSNLTKKYDIRAYPTFVLIDKEGQIVLKAIGAEGLSRVRDRLSEMVDFM
jgi:thiol-disulfide isomerase/thioredoxin